MATTAQDVFSIAMNLMDEISQDGTYDGFPNYYKTKSWSILTNLHTQLLPASMIPIMITGPSTTLLIDDKSAITILPYGLAAHLLMTQDMNRASFFNNMFDDLKRTRPVQIIPIIDVLGVGGPTTTVPTDGGSFLDPNSNPSDGGSF